MLEKLTPEIIARIMDKKQRENQGAGRPKNADKPVESGLQALQNEEHKDEHDNEFERY